MQRPNLSPLSQAPPGILQRQPAGGGRRTLLKPPPPHELSELHKQIAIVGEPQLPNDVLNEPANLRLQGSDLDELFSTRKLKAIFKLGELKDERAVLTLIAVLEDKIAAISGLPAQKKALAQQMAADALGQIGGTAALAKLNDLLNDPGVPDQRSMGARGLSGATGSQAATMLLARLKKETDAGVKGAILAGLGNVGGSLASDQEKQAIVKELVREMEGNTGSLKVSAINALGKIKHKSATDPLLSQLKARMSNAPVARDIVTALGEIRDPNAVELLAILLKDHGDPSVRGESALALGKIGGPKALEVLKSRLKLEKDARVQANIQQAIP